MLTRAPRWRHHGAPKAFAMGSPRRGEHDVPDHDVRTEQLRARESGRQRWCSPASRDPTALPRSGSPEWENGGALTRSECSLYSYSYVNVFSHSHSHQLNLPISHTSVLSFRNNRYQPTYFVASSLSDATTRMRDFCDEHILRPFHVRYSPYSQTIAIDRAVTTHEMDKEGGSAY